MYLRSCFVGLFGPIGIYVDLNEQIIFMIGQEIIHLPKFIIKTGIKNISFRHIHSIGTNLAFYFMIVCDTWEVLMLLFIYRWFRNTHFYTCAHGWSIIPLFEYCFILHRIQCVIYCTHFLFYYCIIIAMCGVWHQAMGEIERL